MNKAHYSFCYPICGSRPSIFEEEEQEEECVELDMEKVGNATLPAGCWHARKMRLYCSSGSCKDSVEQEIVMNNLRGDLSTTLNKTRSVDV